MNKKPLKGGFSLDDEAPDPAAVQAFVRGAGALPPTRAIGDESLAERTAHLTQPHHTTPHPWRECNPRVLKNYNLKLPEPLHAKLAWLSEHGHGSQARMMLRAIEGEAARLLAEHGITDA